jgi:phytol kinase
MVPYFATLVGGIAANILFGPAAIAGYLVAGWGDAVGEPVGVRFGRHTYRVPSRRSVPSFRSYEGSAAVFVTSLLALVLAVAVAPSLSFSWHSILTVPLVALAATLAEAVSPHGWDNATMQIVPAFLAYMVAG